jgi:hypothetical protein
MGWRLVRRPDGYLEFFRGNKMRDKIKAQLLIKFWVTKDPDIIILLEHL